MSMCSLGEVREGTGCPVLLGTFCLMHLSEGLSLNSCLVIFFWLGFWQASSWGSPVSAPQCWCYRHIQPCLASLCDCWGFKLRPSVVLPTKPSLAPRLLFIVKQCSLLSMQYNKFIHALVGRHLGISVFPCVYKAFNDSTACLLG